MTAIAPHITAFFQERLTLDVVRAFTPVIHTPTPSSCF